MGRKCCIAGCTSTSRLPEHHGVTYHSFPLDQSTRSIWIRNTRISADRQITKSVLVCSRHFRRADFQPQRSGKYLLKQKVFPTVFPWGKVDTAQIEADMEFLSTAGSAHAPVTLLTPSSTVDEDTKATVAATVAQIMAQTAELNAAAALKNEKETFEGVAEPVTDSLGNSSALQGVRFEPVTSFTPGARLEAQDFDGIWHSARITEVDNDDREVLIKFERTGKNKSAIAGTEEWIPMNSSRLRQRISTKPIPVFVLEEKCLARWSGPRKFPGTVKKVLPNDTYEILFDDGFVKNVRALHMTKIESSATAVLPIEAGSPMQDANLNVPLSSSTPSASGVKRPAGISPAGGPGGKKRAPNGPRKDWPLLDLSKLDIASLNLPEIPQDGEWACHWVNDQPIGREGFLVVGEHRKPTVIVEDWRLPPGWVKHMYQRSNVLGKWDVILVTPSNKRFRSKADLKTFLEEQGQIYNPDIYDFSIHRRRAKDINCYAYTPDYVPQQQVKKSSLDSSLDSSLERSATETAIPALNSPIPSQFMESIIESMPPIELLTSSTSSLAAEDKSVTQVEAEVPKQLLESAEANSTTPTPTTTPTVGLKEELPRSSPLIINTLVADPASPVPMQLNQPKVDDGYALIGGLKVQIIDNLFRCPQEGCFKNFRKENHLQIHVKHYHRDLIKLLGSCPKMLELAEKRTHPNVAEINEPAPKNQIPNQQFFAKLHQQDLEHTRAHRRSVGAGTPKHPTVGEQQNQQILSTNLPLLQEIKIEDIKTEDNSQADVSQTDTSTINSTVENSFGSTTTNADDSLAVDNGMGQQKLTFSPNRKHTGSRKSSRQRTTRKYLTAAHTTGSGAGASAVPIAAESNFVGDFEETRHSFNATPDINKDAKKRKSNFASNTPLLSSVDSPITADSGSSSLQQTISMENEGAAGPNQSVQYIKENGELIKIVRMRQEEIINCLCGYGEEDGLMIQCELCLCWQHGICNGIDKEAQVPDKYVCYICRNPQKARESMKFKHDQDWLYEGKLPVANYHMQNPQLPKRFEYLKKSHSLTGNLLELKNFMHSLKVKINIANNKCHPKLYLWAKKWDDEIQVDSKGKLIKREIKTEPDVQKLHDVKETTNAMPTTPLKKIKIESITPPIHPIPIIPQPEAPIDPVECQQRLLEHIKIQQQLVMNRLGEIEAAMDDLERADEMEDLRSAEIGCTKDVLATFIKELDTVKQIAKLNTLEHTKIALKNPVPAVK